MNKRSNCRLLASLVVAALVAGPATVASQEGVQEESTAKSVKSEETATKTKASPKGESGDSEKTEAAKEAAAHPSFNTIEEIVSLRGGVATLWTPRPAPAPPIRWRVVEPDEETEIR